MKYSQEAVEAARSSGSKEDITEDGIEDAFEVDFNSQILILFFTSYKAHLTNNHPSYQARFQMFWDSKVQLHKLFSFKIGHSSFNTTFSLIFWISREKKELESSSFIPHDENSHFKIHKWNARFHDDLFTVSSILSPRQRSCERI